MKRRDTLNPLVVAVGIESDTIEELYELYLIQEGFLSRTARRRQVNSFTYSPFGLDENSTAQPTLF